MPTKITYNGKTTELGAKCIATLSCKDYTMATDVVIEAPHEYEIVEEWDGSGVVIEAIATEEPEEPEAPEEPVEDELAGTWLIDDYPTVLSGSFTANVNFTSNGVVYSSITVSEVAVGCNIKYDNTAVLSGGSMIDFPSWTSSAYKTINITTEPTDSTFIEWLKANATKQGATEPKYQLSIERDGIIYHWDVDSSSALWLSLNGKYDTTNTYYINCPYASSIVELYNSAGFQSNVSTDAEEEVTQYGDYNYSVAETYYAVGNHAGGSN
jgi:hypothetical protein